MPLHLDLARTLFPAAAAGARLSPLTALRAARRTWWRLALQLPLLPGLYLVLLIYVMGPVLDWLDRTEPLNPLAIAVEVLLTALLLVPQVLTAVILTRAYRRGWLQAVPGPVASPGA